MSKPATASASKSLSNPLQDDELSEVTKQEILFWSNKLKVTPSQLFSLTRGELDVLLQDFLMNENDKQQQDEQKESVKNQSEVKEKLVKNQQKGRLKGGAGNNLWEILGRAARDIECMYGPQSGEYEQSAESFSGLYDDTEESYDVYSEDEPSFESTVEDISFNIDENLASTPHSYRGANRTYCVPNANATYNVAPANATYNVVPANATYNVTPRNATFTCPNSSYNLSAMSPPSGMSSACGSPANTIQVDSWSPQQWAHVSDSSDVANAQSFRNYTDYSIKYGPTGTKEASSSISVENFDDTSGQVTASSRTFTLPPATSATSAIMLSKISPPHLASGVMQRGARETAFSRDSNLSNVSQPLLASGCSRRSARSSDLSNISPPALASGCRRVRSPSSTLRSDLSNMTPPALASGCARRSPQSGFQLADISQPQLASGRCPTESSFDIANISPPSEMASANRCPHLSAALKAQTPMRIKPNRPYCPRRIC